MGKGRRSRAGAPSRDAGRAPLDPVLAALMDLGAADVANRVPQRLQELRTVFEDERDPIRLGLLETELVRQLAAIEYPAPEKMAAAVLPGREKPAPPPKPGRDLSRPQIDAADHDLPHVSQLAWDAVEKANVPPQLFLVGTVPSRLESEGNGAPPALCPLTLDRLRFHVARMAGWFVFGGKEGTRDALPPEYVVRDMLANPKPRLPALTRIVQAPVFAADGRLLTTPGYDDAAQLFYAPASNLKVPGVAERPTREDLARAKALLLDELVVNFPFVGDADRAHAIALFLLPFVRDMIEGPTPMHFFDKPDFGTGASLLAQVLLHPALGHPVAVMTVPKDEDEWRKRITAKLLGAAPVILIDNVSAHLKSNALSSALTEPVWEDRYLGTMTMVRVAVRCAWAATGINAALSGDLPRRTALSRLDAKMERPFEGRQFKHALPAWGVEHRGELIWAALTMGQAWIAAGRPEGRVVLGRFEGWSRVLGGILDVAEVPGFLGNTRELYELADAEGAEIRRLLVAWWQAHGEREIRVGELFDLVTSDAVDFDLPGKTDRGQRTALGRRLAALRERRYTVADDAGQDVMLRIVPRGTRQGVGLWRLEQTPVPAPALESGKSTRGTPGPPGPETTATYGGGPPGGPLDPPW